MSHLSQRLAASLTAMFLTVSTAHSGAFHGLDDLDKTRPFNRVCQDGGTLFAEFLPSEFDRNVRVSANGPYLHKVHPTGMKEYFSAADVRVMAGVFASAPYLNKHMKEAAVELRKALDAVGQSTLGSAPQCQHENTPT